MNREDSAKLFFELFKHMTTLSTGTIVVMGTFLENVFQNPEWMFLVVITFVGFIASLIFSLGAMIFFAIHVREPLAENEKTTATYLVILSMSGFLVGMMSLTTFAVKNLMA